jgi:pumilio family protein 6
VSNTFPTCIAGLIKAFKGHAAELLRHPAGTHVLDDLYSVATPAQRNSLAAEFYGREYSLFAGGTLNTIKGAPASLMEILSAVEPPKRRDVIHHIASSITPVIEKGLVDCQLAHRLIAEYLTAAPGSLVEEAVGLLSGDAMMHMLHTRHGATASCMIFAYGTSKTRKKALKALKGHISTAVRDEWAYLPLITALSVVDDTASLQKFIVADLEVRSLVACLLTAYIESELVFAERTCEDICIDGRTESLLTSVD